MFELRFRNIQLWGIVSFVCIPCLLRLILIIFLVLLRFLVLVLRTGALARVGGCRSVLEPGSWSTPLVVRSFVVSSMMKLRHRTVIPMNKVVVVVVAIVVGIIVAVVV